MIKQKPRILLASYPRSGNTFFRNILLDVYNIFSWNNLEKYNLAFERIQKMEEKAKLGRLSLEKMQKLKDLKDKTSFPVLKTHEMPDKILPFCDDNPVIIYLVRDGRDSIVSMAHHNVDIVNPGSDFSMSLKQAIIAPGGSHFGGWSNNVKAWCKIATKIIYFEELIENPLETVESLRGIIDLPQPDTSKVPTFESQRDGGSYFGGQSRDNYTDKEKLEFNKKFFRSGKTGGWKNEMSTIEHNLYWTFHGKTTKKMGYAKDGTFTKVNTGSR